MTTITLNILASDIRKEDYNDVMNCPITKALHRAGYTYLRDSGSLIRSLPHHSKELMIKYTSQQKKDLVFRVLGMYGTRFITEKHYLSGSTDIPNLPIEDFTYLLTINL